MLLDLALSNCGGGRATQPRPSPAVSAPYLEHRAQSRLFSVGSGERSGGETSLAGPARAPGERAALCPTATSDHDYLVALYLRDVTAVTEPGVTNPANPWAAVPREQLVLRGLRTVVQIALHYRGMGLPLADLINEGNLGLLRAAELYDPGRCVRFTYYAQPWIRVHMQRALSYQAWPIKYPADFIWRRNCVSRAEAELRQSLRRPPGDREVARSCGLGLPTVRRVRSSPSPSFVPLDSPVAADETGLTLAETIPDEQAEMPDQEAGRRLDGDFVRGLLNVLTPAEQAVIRLRFGLEDGVSRTLDEVGRMLGYVRQGVHRLERAALKRLRSHARFLARTEEHTQPAR